MLQPPEKKMLEELRGALSNYDQRVSALRVFRPEIPERMREFIAATRALVAELEAQDAATYLIIEDGRAIKCLVCESVSYNANDVRERYCGRCHKFHEGVRPVL